MRDNDLKQRTKAFSHRVLDLCDALAATTSGRIISNQLGRCGTSVGANYRACCKARSKAEFIAKVGIVEEEADEAAFWLELVVERAMLPAARVTPLREEAAELSAIMASSRITAVRNRKATTKA